MKETAEIQENVAATSLPTWVPADINRAENVTAHVDQTVQDMFECHTWDDDQQSRGVLVRMALIHAIKTIIDHVPPGPDRSVAIRKIREARMDCNSAITHGGKY